MPVDFVRYGTRIEVTQKQVDDERNMWRSKGAKAFKKSKAKRKISNANRKINR